MRLRLPVEFSVVLPPRRAAVEGRLETLLKVLPSNPRHGRLARLHGVGNLLVHQARPLVALVRFEQDAGVGEFAGGGGTRGYEPLEIVSLGFAENYGIFLIHNGASVPAVTSSNHITSNGLLGVTAGQRGPCTKSRGLTLEMVVGL